jgi:AcrR family transcriptional regulator
MNKRELLLNTSLALFYKNGIHAVGINEILAQSGIAKKTLYNHFDSKDALILACLKERDLRFMNWLTDCCTNKSTITDFVVALFHALDNWINNRVSVLDEFNGCFFVNASAEYSDKNTLIYQQCHQHKDNIRNFISQQLNAFKDITEQEHQQIIDALMLLKEGCINCAFVMDDKQSAIKAKKFALTLVSGLISPITH